MSYDPYAVLGVDRTASIVEIEDAWKAAIRRLHPDTQAGADADEEEMATRATARINRAWQTLRDPVRRAAVDLDLRDAETRAGEPSSTTAPPPPRRPADRRGEGTANAGDSDGREGTGTQAETRRPRRVRTTPERERERARRERQAAMRRAASQRTGAARSAAGDHTHRHGDLVSVRGVVAYALLDREGQRISNALVAGTGALLVLVGGPIAPAALVWIAFAFLAVQLITSRRWCHTPASDLWAAGKLAMGWLWDAYRDARAALHG